MILLQTKYRKEAGQGKKIIRMAGQHLLEKNLFSLDVKKVTF